MSDPYERELVINWSEGEPDVVYCWTASRPWGTRLTKLAKRYGCEIEQTSRPSWSVCLPAGCLKLSLVRVGRKLTEAERAAAKERFAKMKRNAEPKA